MPHIEGQLGRPRLIAGAVGEGLGQTPVVVVGFPAQRDMADSAGVDRPVEAAAGQERHVMATRRQMAADRQQGRDVTVDRGRGE